MSDSQLIEPSLPLRGITLQELRGALLVNGNTEESLNDTLFSLENYICNLSKNMLLPLTQIDGVSEEDISRIETTITVISPFTLMMFFDNELQRTDDLGKIPYSKKESFLLERFPDKLRARYKRNIADRHARELTEDESDAGESDAVTEETTSDNRAFGRIVDLLFAKDRPSFFEEFLRGATNTDV